MLRKIWSRIARSLRDTACGIGFLSGIVVMLVSLSASASASNDVRLGEFVVEPPTLLCAGFEWTIEGDDNRNAAVSVSYRTKGATEWKEGLPLLRLQGEKTYFGDYFNYDAPNMFAGSIFNLSPDIEYECRFVLSDPDGVRGEATRIVTVTTRSEPKVPEGGRVLHVYPPDYTGVKQEPSSTGIMEAYYGTGKGLWVSGVVEPGDIILVHAGLYKSNRLIYYEPLGLHFHGAYLLTKSGTPDKPIVIKAAGDGEAVFDGNGCYRLFDVMFADYTYIDGLTMRNCDVAVYAGVRFGHGCSGLVVRNCRMEYVGCGVLAQYSESQKFYIADNVILGRDDPKQLRGWTGMWKDFGELSKLDSFIGIDINGQGHAVCHNYIRGFNAAQHGLSAQPIYGGPAYFIRNIVYHVPPRGAFKFNIYPSGVLVYHNTLCSEWTTSPPYSNVHVRNNLFLGIDFPKRPILSASTYTSYTSFDYDGFRYNKNSEEQFRWRSPGEGKLTDYTLKENTLSGSFKIIEEFSAATGQERHGTILDYDIFTSVTMPDRNYPPAAMIKVKGKKNKRD